MLTPSNESFMHEAMVMSSIKGKQNEPSQNPAILK